MSLCFGSRLAVGSQLLSLSLLLHIKAVILFTSRLLIGKFPRTQLLTSIIFLALFNLITNCIYILNLTLLSHLILLTTPNVICLFYILLIPFLFVLIKLYCVILAIQLGNALVVENYAIYHKRACSLCVVAAFYTFAAFAVMVA